jgi:hypothetical protein
MPDLDPKTLRPGSSADAAPRGGSASDPVACDPNDAHGHGLRPDALPGPAFQRGILQALLELPDVSAASAGPFRIQVGHGALQLQLRLDELFKRYRHAEIELVDAVEEIKAGLKLPGAAIEAAGPFPRLARPDRLDPAIYRETCPFDPQLCIFYVRELAHGHVPLLGAEVRGGWSGAPERLAREALANLAERNAEVPAEQRGEEAERTVGYASGDGFDAARLLLPGLAEAMDAWLPGRGHFGIPTRDLLMAVGDEDPEFLAGAGAHLRETYRHAGELALSEGWYVLDAEGRLVPLEDGLR